jgi:hypothetical protein
LRAEVRPGLRQASAGELEGRIKPQPVEVVAIGVAAANRQHAGAQDIRDRMRDVCGIAMVGNQHREPVGNSAPPIG